MERPDRMTTARQKLAAANMTTHEVMTAAATARHDIGHFETNTEETFIYPTDVARRIRCAIAMLQRAEAAMRATDWPDDEDYSAAERERAEEEAAWKKGPQ